MYAVIHMTPAVIDVTTQASLANIVKLRKYILTCVPPTNY